MKYDVNLPLRDGLFPRLVPFAFFELFCPVLFHRKAVNDTKMSFAVRNCRCVALKCYKNWRLECALQIRESFRSKTWTTTMFGHMPRCQRSNFFCRFIAHSSLHRLICRFLIQNNLYKIVISDDSRTLVADMQSFTFSLFPPFLSFLRFFACLHYLGGTDLAYRITFCVTNKCFEVLFDQNRRTANSTLVTEARRREPHVHTLGWIPWRRFLDVQLIKKSNRLLDFILPMIP